MLVPAPVLALTVIATLPVVLADNVAASVEIGPSPVPEAPIEPFAEVSAKAWVNIVGDGLPVNDCVILPEPLALSVTLTASLPAPPFP